MSDEIKLDEIVQAFLSIRNQREAIAREFELKDAELDRKSTRLNSSH